MNIANILPLALGLILTSFFINASLVVPFINLLYKLKFLRRNEGELRTRKSIFDQLHDHKTGTPVGGGILLIITTSILFAITFPLLKGFNIQINSAYNLSKELIVIFFTFLSFGLLGFLDDWLKIFGKPRPGVFGSIFGLSREQKFGLQWILGLFIGWLLYSQLGIHILYIPLLNIVFDLGVGYVFFSAFIIVLFTNAYNFTDGLDGLASGLLMIYLFAYVVIAINYIDTPIFVFITLWIGSIIAFLYFNVFPARIFLGDAGALSFGATIAVIGLLIGNVPALLIIGGLFIIEAMSSGIQILSKKFLKRKVFPIAPLHHTLLYIGWEEPKVVMRAWLAGIILAVFGLWLSMI